MKKSMLFSLAAVVVSATAATAGEKCRSSQVTTHGSTPAHLVAARPDQERATTSKQADIVDTAVSAGKFTTLVAAVKAAGLVDTLKGDGPFTVFAPSDAAFGTLPPGTAAELLKPENKEKLQSILTYHVVPGKVTAADVSNLSVAKTVQGQFLDISTDSGQVKIDNATVVKADIMASNGVIHVIDRVVMPTNKNIVEIAAGNSAFSTLVAAVKAAGMVETLQGDGPFTVLAPTNEAFKKLPKGTVEDLLKPENKEKLTAVLTYHVIAGKIMSSEVSSGQSAATVNGKEITVEIDGDTVMIGDAKVIKTDVEATNGVIHVIDSVLLP